MPYNASSIRNLKVIKAIRGDELIIDLGQTLDGTLEAWMKRSTESNTYRSFEIVSNRYLKLSQEKTSDYYDSETGELLESVKGNWYFDLEQTLAGEESKTIYKGKIYFEEDITGSQGVELSEPTTHVTFIKLPDTPSSYDGEGKIPKINSDNDGLDWGELGNSFFWNDNVLESSITEFSENKIWNSGIGSNIELLFEPTDIKHVFQNGIKLFFQQDYNIILPKTIEILTPLNEGDKISIIYDKLINI